MYPMTKILADGEELDASKHNYTLTFAKGQLPPVNAFWSVTMLRRQEPAADRKPDQPLPHQLPHAVRNEKKPRWLADGCTSRKTRPQCEGVQLAARAQRHGVPGNAPVLAEGDAAFDLAAGEGTWKPPAIVASNERRNETQIEKGLIGMTITRLKTIACGITLFLSVAFTSARAQTNVTIRRGPRHRQGGLYLRLSGGGYYRIQYGYFVIAKTRIQGAWNQIRNIPRVYTPADTAIQTPNSDTPYSFMGVDLRAEPVVLTVPVIEKKRYFSVQADRRLHVQFRLHRQPCYWQRWWQLPSCGAGLERRDTKAVKEVIHSETEFILAAYRTQLFDPGDIDNVKKVQAGYKAQTLIRIPGHSRTKSRTGH